MKCVSYTWCKPDAGVSLTYSKEESGFSCYLKVSKNYVEFKMYQ